jgi:hypothetical protein
MSFPWHARCPAETRRLLRGICIASGYNEVCVSGRLMKIRKSYAMAAAVLMAVEFGIAAFVPGGPVRTHGGDLLAVLLVYCALRAVTSLGSPGATGAALAIAATIEGAQWLRLGDLLGWQGSPLARILLGSSFDPMDLLAYAAGGCVALAIEAAKPRCR